MKNPPRLFPAFVALSFFLLSGPLPAAAQMRVQVGAGSMGTGIVPVGVSALPTGYFTPLMPSAGLNGSLSAPSVAPTPLITVVPNAAPAALAASVQAAAAAPEKAPITVRTPGAAATHVSDEAAAYAVPAAQAPVAKAQPVQRGLVARAFDTLLRRPAVSVAFDGERSAPIFARMGLKEHKPLALPNGTATDEQPTTPSPDREPTTRVEAYGLPGARDVGGIFETSRKVLSADPANTTAVVDAVKAMIDADAARYGVASADLRLIHAQKFTGKGEQADTLFVYFRQMKNGLIVNGSVLSFTIKMLDGRPTIVAQTGQIFPQLDVNTETVLTDDQIMSKIAERTGMPANEVATAFEFYEQKIIYSRGEWRNAKLYVAEGLPFMVAVDVVSGLVFAWDNRTGLESASAPAAGGVSGTVSGKTVDRGPILANSEVTEVALPFLEVKIGGKSYITDKEGKLPADLAVGPEGLDLTSTLSGPWVRVENQQGATLSVKIAVKPGDNKVVFNPNAGVADENTLAQINAFQKVNLSLNFLRERGLSSDRMDKTQLPVRTNINDECNAYYTPGRPTLNFFRSSKNCVNSAYDTVAEHENGHYWDDFTGGIVNGGMSEGWGDILSMFRLNNPIIGEHFMKQARGGVDYIRHGENTYQYNEFDQVHDQGQAWGGFAWKLRKALIAKLGHDDGAAMAESLVMPTMFAKTTTIPNAMAQVLVNATAKNGAILHEAEIRAAAKAHGVTLPTSGTGVAAGFLSRFAGPLSALRFTGSEQLGVGVRDASLLAAEAETPSVKAKMTFTLGALYRGRVLNQLRRYLDEAGVKYELKSYGGWLSTDYLLVIEGPQDEVRAHIDTIQRWFNSLETR